MLSKVILFCLLALLCGRSSASTDSEAAKRVLNILNDPTRYNKAIRPYLPKDAQLEVESNMHIKHIAVDDINMVVKVDLFHRLFWQDPRLALEGEESSRVRFTDSSKFWVPDIFSSDATDSSSSFPAQTLVMVDQNGFISYSKRVTLTLKCDMDITFFPHDAQRCPISFESYAYDSSEIILKLKEDDPVTFDQNIQIVRKFSLVDVEFDAYTSETKSGVYSGIRINLLMQRKFYAYFLEWYLPLMVYAMVAFSSLYVSDFFTRIFLTVVPLTVILASILYYSQNLPSVPYVTAIDVFTVITTLAIVATLLSALVTHYKQMNNIPDGKVEFEKSEKWRRLYGMLRLRSHFFTKLFIIGSYCVFLFGYFVFFSA